ncbi:MAG: hypothetical protein FRX49_08996 [Trebouxia sp. A1-2]|nr:MAG: hypothetical protein FRX49_08996 [Trebouxia sp. A1-2]
MAVTPAILLAKLQGLDIPTEVISHPAVLTVELSHLKSSVRSIGQEEQALLGDSGGINKGRLERSVPSSDTLPSKDSRLTWSATCWT